MAITNMFAKSNIKNVLTQAVGITGLGLIAYDSHTYGKINSSAHQKKSTADELTDSYIHSETLETPSIVQSKVKKGYFNFVMEDSLLEFFHSATGYIGGFSSMLVSSVIPLALSLGTLVGSKGAKGLVSKTCGVGLLAYGGVFLIRDVLGIGKPNPLGKDY